MLWNDLGAVEIDLVLLDVAAPLVGEQIVDGTIQHRTTVLGQADVPQPSTKFGDGPNIAGHQIQMDAPFGHLYLCRPLA